MNKKLILALAAFLGIAGVANAQTYKPDYATKVVLAGNGTDLTNTFTINAPALAGALTWTLPTTGGTNGFVLKTNGSGTLSWIDPAAAANAWNLTGNASSASNFIGTTDNLNPFLIKTNSATRISISGTGTIGVPAFSTGVVHSDASGNLSSSLIVNADITAATIDLTTKVTGILPIANGGSGISTSATPGAVVFGATATTMGYTAAGTTGMTLHSAGAGTPTWSKLDLSSSSEVTGVLSPANGGTGVNNGTNTITLGGNMVTANSFTTSGNFPLTLTTTGATNVTLPTSGTLLAAGGPGSFSTLTSTGNTTLGTGASATTNSFGTGAGNTVAVSNTIGSSFAGSMTTINGPLTVSGLTAQPGVVHNSAAGLLSSSGVATADIIDGNVTNAKLANSTIAVGSTGSTLSVTGSPISLGGTAGNLEINLNHANTWTATQTFPTTAAQGDALIASLNASTQPLGVAHGGTGVSTAPTTGGVAYGASATTIGYTAAGTTGQVLQSNGSGAPTWVNAGATVTYASSTSNAITTTTNDFAISSTQTIYYLQNTSGSSQDLTGIVAGAAGRMIILVNNGPNQIVLKDKNALSQKPNQFHLQGASDIILGVDGTVSLVYDPNATNSGGATGAWRVIANY